MEEGVGVIAHRVIAIAPGDRPSVDTQGDNNDHPDLWGIYEENLIGLVTEVNPPAAVLFSESFRYVMLAIIVGSAVLLGWQAMPRRSIEVKQLTCLRCGNRWHPRIIDGKAKFPDTCPNKNCRSPYWRTKAKKR